MTNDPVAPADVATTVLAVLPHPLPYYTLQLETESAAFDSVHPGQFVMAQVLDHLEPYLRRAFSVFDVSKSAGATRVELLGKIIGSGTRALAGQRAGDRVPLLGPLGRGFHIVDSGRAALVAGGVGSAALLLLARALADRGVAFDFYYGGRSRVDLARSSDFRRLAESVGGRLICTTEDGSGGERGLITEPLERGLAGSSYDFVYTCGPMGLMRQVARLAAEHGAHGEAALETPMGCGYGACLGCAVQQADGRIALCCQDGPVFELAAVDWDRMP